MAVPCKESSTIVTSSRIHGDVLSDEGRVDLMLSTSNEGVIILLQIRYELYLLIFLT